MTNCTTAHSGFELDLMDLSRISETSSIQDNPRQNNGIINHKTFLKDLLKKIFNNQSFLSFFVQIKDVNKILSMNYSSANDIANVLIKDVALTTKLLKLVNSSFYGQFSHKGIATISEAMIILGTEEIKLAAASLKIYELIQDIAKINILKRKAFKALQRSLIARQIAVNEGMKDAEALQISAMLYDFGEYLVVLFSPEVFIKIEICADENGLSKEQASKSVIGISYSELGRFVASKWNLPASILNAMKPVKKLNLVKSELTAEDLQRYICAFSNDLCDIEASAEGQYSDKKIAELSKNYNRCLQISTAKSIELLKTSGDKITTHASILKVDAPER